LNEILIRTGFGENAPITLIPNVTDEAIAGIRLAVESNGPLIIDQVGGAFWFFGADHVRQSVFTIRPLIEGSER
jgi:hypothetical protein